MKILHPEANTLRSQDKRHKIEQLSHKDAREFTEACSINWPYFLHSDYTDSKAIWITKQKDSDVCYPFTARPVLSIRNIMVYFVLRFITLPKF